MVRITAKCQQKTKSYLIDLVDKSNLIYVTENGIETLNIKTKTKKLTFAKAFRINSHNNLQIKYIGK